MRATFLLPLLVIASCIISGCTSTRYAPVGSDVHVTEKETFIPVPIQSDSATIRALLACDKNGRVVLEWLDAEKSRNARLKFSLDSLGMLVAKMKTVPDTVYLPSKETVISKEVKVPYPVERKLTRWESVKQNIGGYAIYSMVAAIFIFFGKIFYKIKKGR